MVITIAARVVEAEIMNMMIICSFAACDTEEPPRMAPVIMPGMDIMPMTLIWLIVGVSARRRASRAMGVHASNRDAPKARYVSILSRLSYSSFKTYAMATTTPETVLPQSMPTIGIYCSGFQNGSTAMAYRVPMIETGIVEPSMHTRTERNMWSNRFLDLLATASTVPKKFNRKAIPATAHGLFVSNTRCRSSPTIASCTMHRMAAEIREFPTPRLNEVDTTASKNMNENPRATFAQLR